MTPAPQQCKDCLLDGLRLCMYHGYPETTIPPICDYRIVDIDRDEYCINELRSRSRPAPSPQVPTSAELIQMAKHDWINRYMRKGTLDEFSFETGWMAGFLTPNKPDWSKAHDATIRNAERNATLDAIEQKVEEKWEFMFGVLPYNTEISKKSMYDIINSLRTPNTPKEQQR